MRVALVTCLNPPEPDEDEVPLTDALRVRGVDASVVAWDDPAVSWSAFDHMILRSTWDYHRRADEFLAWLDRAAAVSHLWNPADVVRWNAHKGYLVELAMQGHNVTPTALLKQHEARSLASVMEARGWSDVVVKPAVSAGSFGTLRVGAADLAPGERHLIELLQREDVLVQPYVDSVEGYGERAVVWLGGEPSHAVRKTPRFTGEHESVSDALPIAPDELEASRALLEPFGGRLLYARVDLARDASNRPLLMELELIEPSLFLGRQLGALDRFADVVAGLSRGS